MPLAASVRIVIRLRALGPLLPLLIGGLALVSCGGDAKPEGWAAPVLTDDTYFVFQRKEELSAIDRETGAVRWTFPNDSLPDQEDIDLDAVYGTPLLHEGRLFLGSYAGDLFALDEETGSLLWKKELNGPVVGSPVLVEDEAIVAGTTEGRIYVVNAADGSPLAPWPSGGIEAEDEVWGRAVALEGGFAIPTMDGRVQRYELDTAAPDPAWGEPFKTSGAIASLAQTPDGKIFALSLDRRAYLLDADTGDQDGNIFEAEEWLWGEPAFDGNLAYVGDLFGHVYEINLENMQANWVYKAESRMKSSPVVLDNLVVVADREPVVHFIKRSDGTAQHTIPIQGTKTIRADAVTDDGFVYFISVDGRLLRADPAQLLVSAVEVGRFR